MSFFAGRLNGSTTLSLKNEGGGSINNHLTPDANTIFHSSMPHVIITETYTVPLADAGSGYAWSIMPDQIINYHNNDSNRVILTEVEFSNGSKHMISGMSLNIGAKAYGFTAGTLNNWTTEGGNKTNMIASADITMDVGYFPTAITGTTLQKMRDGTGCQYVFGSTSGSGQQMTPGVFLYTGGAGLFKGSDTPNGPEPTPPATITVPSGVLRHPGLRGYVMDAIYVRGFTPNRILYGTGGPLENANTAGGMTVDPITAFYSQRPMANVAMGIGFVKSDPSTFTYWTDKPDANDYATGPIGVNYEYLGIDPVKVTWYVTNLVYNGNGFNVTGELFTGADIFLNNNNFYVKGVNLMNTPWKFINFVQANNSPGNRPDIRNIGCNVAKPTATSGINGIANYSVPLATSSNAPAFSSGNVSELIPCCVSIYNFQPSASWYVNSSTNSIGNQWGDVWSPTNLPLRLIAGSGSATLSGSINFVSGGSIQLATMPLGLATTRDGAIVCTMEFLDDSWISAGGIGCFNPQESLNLGGTTNDSRLRVGPNETVKKLHQILSLPINYYVPFYTVKANVVNATESRSAQANPVAYWVPNLPNNNAQSGSYTITYFLKNESNGNVSVWIHCGADNITGMKIGLPNMKITVQRLS